MIRRRLVHGFMVGTVAALVAAVGVPVASAQQGSLRGKVVNDAGQPVAEAVIVLDFVGDYTRQFKTVTDRNGEWVRAGMPSGGGTWTITVTKGDLTGRLAGIRVMIGQMTRVEDIVIRKAGVDPAAAAAAANLTNDEIAKRNKRAEELEKIFNEANAAVDAGNYDEAIAKIAIIAAEVESCASCHARMGDIYNMKKDVENAEKAYLKAIEIDPKEPQPYSALATIYNQQRRFDDAAKMSQKALELQGETGGGDAGTVFNQGIIFWNQGKAPEAQAQFEKAIALDAKMADAHYWLGMALVNQGKLQEAKVPFQTYLKLAPDGPNAATAKAILDTIK